MVAKCNECGTIWADNGAVQSVLPTRVPVQRCGDCATFDWPNYTKRVEYARAMDLEGKNRKKKQDQKTK